MIKQIRFATLRWHCRASLDLWTRVQFTAVFVIYGRGNYRYSSSERVPVSPLMPDRFGCSCSLSLCSSRSWPLNSSLAVSSPVVGCGCHCANSVGTLTGCADTETGDAPSNLLVCSFKYVFAYFPSLLSSLVVPAASAEDSTFLPPPGALPLPGTLPSGTSANRCCQDERVSAVREARALKLDSISASPSCPATCLVSCSPEGYEKLYLLGDGFSIFSYSSVSAGSFREDGPRILSSIYWTLQRARCPVFGCFVQCSFRLRSTDSAQLGTDFVKKSPPDLDALAKRDTWMVFSGADTHSPVLLTVFVALDKVVDWRA